ncbi:MAG TPA: SDR family oxidoreductase, partial [Dongiaceae bacterium]|nr:SDR family oxidoreductase [Dongiaceae bacterium]
MRLAGKIALITGAGSGLGRESALRFAAEGARIAVVDLDRAAAVATAEAIAGAGGTAIPLQADVTRSEDCAEMVAATERAFGALHILFNNAGIMLPDDTDPVATSLEVWERTIAVNLTGVFLGCKHGIPALLRAGGGAIVNMASMVAFVGSATPQLAYAASKGGVVALTQEIAAIYARRNIRANALCPGPVRTPLSDHLFATEAERERRRVHQPMGRLATPGEIANAALF